jgi:hypothetical protein
VSQLGPSNLINLPSAPIYRHGHDVTDSLSLSHAAESMRTPEGFIDYGRLCRFAQYRYPNDVTLAAWTWGVLLQDRVFFGLRYPESGVVGRPFALDVLHATTLQTREDWLGSSKDPDMLMLCNPALWLIGQESLKSQYHRLYVHQTRADHSVDNNCHDGQGHYRYVAPHGYSSDLRHLNAEVLDQQASEQGLNPCIYSFLHEWVLTWL